ncbi:MAG: hypothetical protein ACKOD1_00810 [Sphingomonadales bacterium]
MKSIIFLFSCLLICSTSVWSQTSQPAAEDVRMEKTAQRDNLVFKAVRSGVDNIEMIEVIGLGTASFKVSNMADGTYGSYEHSLRVAYPLVLTGGKTGYVLCFYGAAEKIPYAVETKSGITTIYFPISTHDVIKARIEQTIAIKKKIVFKLSQLADGYREAMVGGN